MLKFILISFVSLILSNCAVYKIDVQQGNVVTQEMLDQLELNMPSKKVRFIMGSPILIDVFHLKRWDYLYSFQKGGDAREQRHIALFFDRNDRLIKVAGDITYRLKPASPKQVEQPVL